MTSEKIDLEQELRISKRAIEKLTSDNEKLTKDLATAEMLNNAVNTDNVEIGVGTLLQER